MAEYVVGTKEDLAAFRAQLAVIYKDRSAVLIGSFGRAALYETFGWEVEPLTVRKRPKSDVIAERDCLRDIDVIGVAKYISPTTLWSRPHTIDINMQNYVAPGSPPELSVHTSYQKVDRRVFATRTRRLAGVPVRTLLVSTQLQMEQLVTKQGEPRYGQSLSVFRAFAETLRDDQREFLPEELYAPFAQPCEPDPFADNGETL